MVELYLPPFRNAYFKKCIWVKVIKCFNAEGLLCWLGDRESDRFVSQIEGKSLNNLRRRRRKKCLKTFRIFLCVVFLSAGWICWHSKNSEKVHWIGF
jgi:hypothetical protein